MNDKDYVAQEILDEFQFFDRQLKITLDADASGVPMEATFEHEKDNIYFVIISPLHYTYSVCAIVEDKGEYGYHARCRIETNNGPTADPVFEFNHSFMNKNEYEEMEQYILSLVSEKDGRKMGEFLVSPKWNSTQIRRAVWRLVDRGTLILGIDNKFRKREDVL